MAADDAAVVDFDKFLVGEALVVGSGLSEGVLHPPEVVGGGGVLLGWAVEPEPIDAAEVGLIDHFRHASGVHDEEMLEFVARIRDLLVAHMGRHRQLEGVAAVVFQPDRAEGLEVAQLAHAANLEAAHRSPPSC